MPRISYFYGITIFMHATRKEHNPPHIHAFYGERSASFSILTGEIMDGSFPKKGSAMVKRFILRYQKELLEMWEKEIYCYLSPIE